MESKNNRKETKQILFFLMAIISLASGFYGIPIIWSRQESAFVFMGSVGVLVLIGASLDYLIGLYRGVSKNPLQSFFSRPPTKEDSGQQALYFSYFGSGVLFLILRFEFSWLWFYALIGTAVAGCIFIRSLRAPAKPSSAFDTKD